MNLLKNIFKIKESKYLELLPDFKKEKTQKISSIVFSLVSLSFFGLFAISPTLSTIAKLKKELADSMFVNQKLQEKISNLYSLSQKYNLIQNDIPIVLAAVPQNPQIPTLIGQIQAISSENNITLTSIQSFPVEAVSSETSGKDFSSFSFAVSGQGAYKDIINFMLSLTDIRRVISIESLSINKQNSSNNLGFNMKGTGYFKK